MGTNSIIARFLYFVNKNDKLHLKNPLNYYANTFTDKSTAARPLATGGPGGAVKSYAHILVLMLDTDGYIWDLLTAIRTAEENPFSVRDLHPSNGHFTKFKVSLAARAVPAGHNDPHSCDALPSQSLWTTASAFSRVGIPLAVCQNAGKGSRPLSDDRRHHLVASQLGGAVDLLAEFRQAELHAASSLVQENAGDGEAAGRLFLLHLF